MFARRRIKSQSGPTRPSFGAQELLGNFTSLSCRVSACCLIASMRLDEIFVAEDS